MSKRQEKPEMARILVGRVGVEPTANGLKVLSITSICSKII
jgi:hypothetical protein